LTMPTAMPVNLTVPSPFTDLVIGAEGWIASG
jgi:hypothetical protein